MTPRMDPATKIAIPCPDCGTETEKTVRWLRRYQTMKCQNCGAVIVLQVEEILSAVREAEIRRLQFL